MKVTLQLKQGTTKHALEIDDGLTLSDLMSETETLTGIPQHGQKLILNGKALTSLDHTRTLKDCRIVNYAKIMVLGKRYDPQGDEMYSRVAEVEKKALAITQKIAEVVKEVEDIEKGFLAREHQEQALKTLIKRCRGSSEEYMRLLETLDGMRFEEHQGDAKHKRKSAVNQINASLDKADGLQSKAETLLDQLQ